MKVGILTEQEAKFFGKIVAQELPIGGIWRNVSGWFLPNLLNNFDDKLGDKIPEPWQTIVEELMTKLYNAMQDGIITDKEKEDIINFCSTVIAKEIDIPNMDEKDEDGTFILLIKWGSATSRNALKKK